MQETGRARRRARWVLAGLALLATLYLAGTYAAPVLRARGNPLGTWLHVAYAPTCHQMPQRSIHIEGLPQAVCARCSGLYIGGVAALWLGLLLVVGRFRRLPAWLFFAACAPTCVDALLGIAGLPQLSMEPRQWISVPAGFVAGLFLTLGVVEITASRRAGSPIPAIAPGSGPREAGDRFPTSSTEFQSGG